MQRPSPGTRARRLRAALVGGAIAGLVPAIAAATELTGFLQPAGKGALSITHTFESYEEFWVGDTKVSDPGVGRVETGSLSLWLEWGVHERVTVVGSLAYVDASSDGLGGFGESGLQDRAVLAKIAIADLASGTIRHRFVGALGLRSPASGYEDNIPVDIGDGSTDGLFRAIYLLQASSFYFSQQAGFDVRSDDTPDGIPLYSELGVTARRLTVSGFYSGYLADGGTDIGDPGFTFPSNGDEFHRLGGKLYYRLTDGFGASAAYFQTLDGRNAGESRGLSSGITIGL
jgi:hypothetical protein